MIKRLAVLGAFLYATTALFVGCGEDSSAQRDTAAAAGGTLFVQSAGSAEIGGRNDEMTLTLNDVSAATTTFNDRPDRSSGTMPTAEFAEDFKGLFGRDLPNADLSSVEKRRGEFLFELSDPRFDSKARTLTYRVRPLAGGSEPPERFGPVSLFIDGSNYTTSAKVSILSLRGQPCPNALGHPVLENPVVVEEPDQWGIEPVGSVELIGTVDDGYYVLFKAVSKHSSTHYEVHYDITCGASVGEEKDYGTLVVKGSVPKSAFNADKFSCATENETGPSVCYPGGLIEAPPQGYHADLTYTLATENPLAGTGE